MFQLAKTWKLPGLNVRSLLNNGIRNFCPWHHLQISTVGELLRSNWSTPAIVVLETYY